MARYLIVLAVLLLGLYSLALVVFVRNESNTLEVPVEFCKSQYTGRTSIVQDAQCLPTPGANGQMNPCGMTNYSNRTVSEVRVTCDYVTWQ